jgi:HrpA-like RNA helicase
MRLLQQQQPGEDTTDIIAAAAAMQSPELSSCYEDTDTLRRCLLSGYFNNVAQLAADGNYRTVRGNVAVQTHYTCDFYRFGSVPEWVLFHEVIASSTMPLMRIVSKVNPLWILREGQHYYSKPDSKLMGPSPK